MYYFIFYGFMANDPILYKFECGFKAKTYLRAVNKLKRYCKKKDIILNDYDCV